MLMQITDKEPLIHLSRIIYSFSSVSQEHSQTTSSIQVYCCYSRISSRAVCNELNEWMSLTVSVISHCVPMIKEPVFTQICVSTVGVLTQRAPAKKVEMIITVITFQSHKFLPHSIMNCRAVFWHLINFQTHGSVTPVGLPESYTIVSSAPETRRAHQHGHLLWAVFSLNTQYLLCLELKSVNCS